jgi:hypothetical protein
MRHIVIILPDYAGMRLIQITSGQGGEDMSMRIAEYLRQNYLSFYDIDSQNKLLMAASERFEVLLNVVPFLSVIM